MLSTCLSKPRDQGEPSVLLRDGSCERCVSYDVATQPSAHHRQQQTELPKIDERITVRAHAQQLGTVGQRIGVAEESDDARRMSCWRRSSASLQDVADPRHDAEQETYMSLPEIGESWASHAVDHPSSSVSPLLGTSLANDSWQGTNFLQHYH